jgi:hypothetical protein
MLKHLFNEVIGHVSSLSDAQLEQIEQALPATKAVIDLLIKAQPFFEQAQTLHTKAEPLIESSQERGRRSDLRREPLHVGRRRFYDSSHLRRWRESLAGKPVWGCLHRHKQVPA